MLQVDMSRNDMHGYLNRKGCSKHTHTRRCRCATVKSMSFPCRRKSDANKYFKSSRNSAAMDNSRPPSSRPMSRKANELSSSASSGRIGTASRLSAMPNRLGTAKNIGIPQKVIKVAADIDCHFKTRTFIGTDRPAVDATRSFGLIDCFAIGNGFGHAASER